MNTQVDKVVQDEINCNDAFDTEMFSHIALSLSGGGIRAVGFHLGTLDLLERMDLLKNVNILSTVSGGSLVGTAYALSAQENGDERFEKCFYNLYDFLPELNTLEDILQNITGDKPASPSGRRDLISGMANVFHERFYSRYYRSTEFGVFWDGQHNHIREIMFNATEFRTGNAFRFQKSRYPCRIGNGEVWIEEEHAKKMRMGDIMASSCCIPVGMEPFFFPTDFHWPDDNKKDRPTCSAVEESLREQGDKGNAKPFVPLMDGGVYDNQGLSSVLLAMLRRNKARHKLEHIDVDEPSTADGWGAWMQNLLSATNNTVDVKDEHTGIDLSYLRLFIVSDTPLRPNPIYPANDGGIPQIGKGFLSGITFGIIDKIAWVLCLLLFISVGDNVYELVQAESYLGLGAFESFRQWMGVFIPTVTCAVVAYAIYLIRHAINRGEKAVVDGLPPFKKSLWFYVKKIRLRDAASMLNLRIGSTAALTTKVYLHRIRQLGYSIIFGTGSGPNSLANRIMTNEIYTLSDATCWSDHLPVIKPGSPIAEIAEIAATTKTAVWVDPSVEYDNRREMDILVAAGQMTCCYNLMSHIRERFGVGDKKILPTGSAADIYYQQLLAIWQQFEEAPFCLVDKRKQQVGINL